MHIASDTSIGARCCVYARIDLINRTNATLSPFCSALIDTMHHIVTMRIVMTYSTTGIIPDIPIISVPLRLVSRNNNMFNTNENGGPL